MGRNIVKVAFTGDAKNLKTAGKQAERAGDGVKKKFSGLGKTIGKAFSVIGIAGGAAFLSGAVKSAIAGEAANAKLTQALKKVTHATKDQIKAAGAFITKTSLASGVTKGELRPAFLSLVTSTHSVSKAQKLLGTAMDVATGTGKPLKTVVLAMGKAYNGSTTALKKFLPSLKITEKGSKGAKQAFAQLNATYGGQTQKAAETTAGKMARLKIQFGALQAKIGTQLLPIINKLADIFLKNTNLVVALVAAIAGFAILNKVVKFIKATKATMTALNATMAANPAVLIALAIAALGVALFVAYKKVKWFHNAVDKAWQILQVGFRWIKANWPLLLAILTGPIGIAVLLIARHWSTIKSTVVGVWQWVRTNWPLLLAVLTGPFGLAVWFVVKHFSDIKTFVRGTIDAITGWFGGVGKTIGGVIGGVADAITSPFRSAFNSIAHLWNDTVGSLSFKIPGWVPGIGGKGFDVPDIPTFHNGGVANFGSKGEGLAWLRNGERILTPEQSGGGSAGTLIQNFPAGISPAAVIAAQKRWQRRNGNTQ